MNTAALRLPADPALPPTRYAQFREQRYFGGFDGARALSVIGVIWYHCAPDQLRGYYGVDAFFILSGFLITTLLLREQSATGPTDLRRFYFRRALRIFPPYYAYVLTFALFYAATRGPSSARFFQDLPFLLTYMTDFFPAAGFFTITWSLAAEEKFYLFWPTLQKVLRRSHALFLLGVFLFFNELLLCRVFALDEGQHTLFKFTFAPILFGVFAAYALHSERVFARLWASPLGKAPAQWGCVATLVFFLFGPTEPAWIRVVLHGAMVTLLVGMILRNDSLLVRALEWAPLRRIGIVSYGMYLFHKVPMAVLYKVAGPHEGMVATLLYMVGSVALTYAMAELSFRTIEAYARTWRDRLV